MREVRQPPTAEDILQSYAECSEEKTRCVARIAEHSKTPVIEDETTDNRLREVVRKAHFAIWCNLDEESACRGAIVE